MNDASASPGRSARMKDSHRPKRHGHRATQVPLALHQGTNPLSETTIASSPIRGANARVTSRVVSKVRRVSVIDPDQRRRLRKRRFQFVAIMNLDENIEAQFAGRSGEFLQFRSSQSRNDQQDRIGAIGPSLDDLIGINNKVFFEAEVSS